MKKLTLALLLLLSTTVFAEKPSTNPADYPITVHVVFSHYITVNPATGGYQQLDTTINGQQVELQGEDGVGVLTPGDYKAVFITTNKQLGITHGFIPKNPGTIDTFTVYRFLLPDGTTRNYDVIGLGPKQDAGSPAPSRTPSTNP